MASPFTVTLSELKVGRRGWLPGIVLVRFLPLFIDRGFYGRTRRDKPFFGPALS
jgi:hypothetical protein